MLIARPFGCHSHIHFSQVCHELRARQMIQMRFADVLLQMFFSRLASEACDNDLTKKQRHEAQPVSKL